MAFTIRISRSPISPGHSNGCFVKQIRADVKKSRLENDIDAKLKYTYDGYLIIGHASRILDFLDVSYFVRGSNLYEVGSYRKFAMTAVFGFIKSSQVRT